jgi:hypothetical protein
MQRLFPNLQNFFVSASDSVRPVLSGMANPFANMFKSKLTMTERKQAVKVKNIIALNRMARDLESSQPSLAAELRYFASR